MMVDKEPGNLLYLQPNWRLAPDLRRGDVSAKLAAMSLQTSLSRREADRLLEQSGIWTVHHHLCMIHCGDRAISRRTLITVIYVTLLWGA
jgi:hypothetical protein